MKRTTANTILDRELPCIEEIHQVHIIGPESDSGMRGDVQHLKLPERRGWGGVTFHKKDTWVSCHPL